MYKSKLQELCQKKAWRLPEYNVIKQGQDHNPQFEATVNVNGMSFQSKNPAKSSKEAQNNVAHLAFLHFTAPPLADPGSCNRRLLQPEADRDSHVKEPTSISNNDEKIKDMQHFYKNVLQNYAQKRNLSRPMYSCESEGPPHASRFRCKVTVDEKTYESLEFFPTIKEAEHDAAKIALLSLAPYIIEEVQEDSSLYKNLLQELTQKEGLLLPIYTTTRSGEVHASMFVSVVEVKGEVFTGQAAKTKKQAEFSAAKVAYTKIKESTSNRCSMDITPAYHEREVHVVSASHLPTNVNADTQQNLGSKVGTLLNSSSTSGADRQEDRGTSNRCSLDITPAYHEREVHVVSASHLPTNVNTDTQQNLGSKAGTLLNSSSTSGADRQEFRVNIRFTGPLRSSSHILSEQPQNLSISNIPPNHLATTNSVEDSIIKPIEMSSLSCDRVVVHPRVPNVKFPAGSTVLPMSDDDWVAVKIRSEPNQ